VKLHFNMPVLSVSAALTLSMGDSMSDSSYVVRLKSCYQSLSSKNPSKISEQTVAIVLLTSGVFRYRFGTHFHHVWSKSFSQFLSLCLHLFFHLSTTHRRLLHSASVTFSTSSSVLDVVRPNISPSVTSSLPS
jgi:hypothetical protein